jgi:hypothetical protein
MLGFLKSKLNIAKYLSDNKWEAHANSVSAKEEHYGSLIEALNYFHSNESEKGDTRIQAGSILAKIEELKLVILLCLWTRLLQEFHKVSNSSGYTNYSLYM